MAIYVASVSVQASRFFDTQYESVTCADDEKITTPACLQKVSPWVTRPEIYFPLYFGFRIVFVNLGPCIALVILNVLLFCALQVSTDNNAFRLATLLIPSTFSI